MRLTKLLLIGTLIFTGCGGDDENGGNSAPVPAVKKERPVLSLDTANKRLDTDPTPTLQVSGLTVLNGVLRLFSDSSCTTAAGGEVEVTQATAEMTADTLTAGNYQFYVQHTDSEGIKGNCAGGLEYAMEVLTMDSTMANDATPDINVAGLQIHSGTLQLFSEATCATAASATVTVTAGEAAVTANTVAAGVHRFWGVHTDGDGNEGHCQELGSYRYTTESLTLAKTAPTVAVGYGTYPTLSVTGLSVLNGSVQLYGDSDCSSAFGDPVTVSATTATVTPASMATGSHDLHVQHIDSDGRAGPCVGSVAYEFHRGAKKIAAGASHTCAILDDDSLKCWGININGQIGDSTNLGRTRPVAVGLGNQSAVAISTGNNHTCAIRGDNSLVCWGMGLYGRLGTGNTNNQNAPTAVNLGSNKTAQAIGLGSQHSCAILNDSTLKCWGSASNGRLGDGQTSTNQHSPVSINLGSNKLAKAIGVGGHHNCVILDDTNDNNNDDTLVCWGLSNAGQVGDGHTTDRSSPVSVNPGDTVKAIAGGDAHTCAILDDNSLKCWGWNTFGTVGNGNTTNQNSPQSVNLGNSRSATTVSAGIYHSCAIRDNGSLVCWGMADFGQLGIGSASTDTCTYIGDDYDCKKSPTVVNLGTDRTAVAISLGQHHTCAILDDNSLVCWGRNRYGQLGDGTTVNKNVPTLISLD